MRRVGFFVMLLLVTGSQLSMQTGEPPAGPSTLDGVFTFSQARAGERVFRVTCSECHESSTFSDEEFLENLKTWQFDSVYDLVMQLETTMPADNAGGLPRREYVDVVAYMLQLSGFPRGDEPLPNDDEGLKHVEIQFPGDMQSDEPPAGPSTLDGVFTFSQARAGERVFRVTCSECHELSTFSGEEFLESLKTWEFDSVYDLVMQLETTMPADNAGGLPRREYVEVAAYMLQLGGFPRGDEPLPNDDEGLKHVKIQFPGGPD